jgi:hypothetical protein
MVFFFYDCEDREIPNIFVLLLAFRARPSAKAMVSFCYLHSARERLDEIPVLHQTGEKKS